MPVRYSARPSPPSGETGGGAPKIAAWSTSLTATFRTDPEILASVLPPPLAPPAEPIAKVGISWVDVGGRMPPFGAGTFAVAARHGDAAGFYPLLMPMTTEAAVVGGREVFGEPKKLARISLDREGETVTGTVARLGTTIITIEGTVGDELEVSGDDESLDFYFKFLRSPEGGGFDDDPWLVHCTRRAETRSRRAVDGSVTLVDSAFDPVADIPVLGDVAITLSERRSDQRGRLVERVPADALLPYVHQRYDDLMLAGARR